MGGKSKSVTVGYRYKMGLHFAISRTAWDVLRAIRVGGRDAWIGNQSESGQIDIDAPKLFGGDKKEGGIDGLADVMMGEPTQGVNDYLVSKIPGLMPAFRGMFSLVFRGGLVTSINPYLKPWILEGTRIKAGWGSGSCWYPETAEIVRPDVAPSSIRISSQVVDFNAADAATTPEGSAGTFTLSGLDPSNIVVVTYPSGGDYIAWSRYLGYGTDPGYYDGPETDPLWLSEFRVKNAAGSTATYRSTQYMTDAESLAAAQAGGSIQITGSTSYKFWLYDDFLSNRGGLTLKIEVFEAAAALPDMNPAHIVYQLVTDPDLEMGYPTADIDTASFTAAADTFYAEGLGLTMSWNRQTKIKDFLQIVLDHAGAALYADPFTGKFVLKAIRGDYDPDTLDVYDEASIIAVEDFQRPGLGEAVNQIIVAFRDRVNHVEAVTPPDQDLASIQAQGAVIGERREYPGFSHMAIAKRIAARDRRAAAARLAKIRIRMNRAFWAGTPAGVVKVSWAKLGLSGVIFRVVNINTGTLESGEISVDLVEDVFGLPDSSYTAQQDTGWEEPDTSPLAIVFEEAYELPYWDLARNLSSTDLAAVDADAGYVAATAARENGLQLSYDQWTRIAPADYADVGIGAFAASALVAAAMARSDTTITYSDGLEFGDLELPVRALIGSGRLAEWVEITANDTGTSTLTVNRGVLDTTPQEFDIGERIFVVAEDNFSFDPTERATGDEVDVKLTANAGGGSADLIDAAAMQVIPDQRFARPYAPGKVQINGLDFPDSITTSITVTWAHRDRTAQTVDYVAQSEGDIGPESGVTYNGYLYNDDSNALIASTTGVAGTSWSPTPSGAFNARLELESARGGTGTAPSLTVADSGDFSLFWTGGPLVHDDLYVAGILRAVGSSRSIRVFFKDDLTLSGGQYVGDSFASGLGQDDDYFYTSGTDNTVDFSGNGVVTKIAKSAGSGTTYELFAPGDPTDLVIDNTGFLWVSCRYGDTGSPGWPVQGVHRIDASTMTITDAVAIADPSGIISLCTDGNYVWSWNHLGTLYRINTATKAVDQTIPGLPYSVSITAGNNHLFYVAGAVYLLSNDRLVKIDPASGGTIWNVDAATGALGNLMVNRGAFIEIDGVPCTVSAIGGNYYLIGIDAADGSLAWQTISLGSVGTYSAFEVSGLIDGTTLVFGFVASGTDGSAVYTITAGGALASWQRQIRTFAYASDLSRITEDSSPRITEDGDSRILE